MTQIFNLSECDRPAGKSTEDENAKGSVLLCQSVRHSEETLMYRHPYIPWHTWGLLSDVCNFISKVDSTRMETFGQKCLAFCTKGEIYLDIIVLIIYVK